MKNEILGLGKDSIIYGAGSAITRSLGFITLPLFTRYLTPEEYGVLAMLALLAMVAQPVFSLGLSAAMGLSYFEKDDQTSKSKVVRSVFSINVASASLLILLSWTFPVFLGAVVRLPAEYSFLVGLSLTGTALTILVTSFTQRVQFEKQARLYVLITMATALTSILVSVYTVVFLGWGIIGMVYGQLAGNLISFLAFSVAGLKGTVPAVSLRTIKDVLQVGLPLVPSFAFLFVLMHSNKYILEWQAGLGAVGTYSIGFNIGMVISIITGGIATAWYPFFMSYMNRQNQVRVVFGRILTYYFLTIGLLCTAFFVFAKPVVQLLTHESFFDAYKVVGFVALANFSQVLFNFFLPSLYYNKEVKYVSVVQGLAALLSLPISYLLIKQYSILGAAISIFIANFIMAIFLYLWNKLYAKKQLVVDYEWRRISCISAVLTLIVIIYFGVPSYSLSLELTKSVAFLLFSIASVYYLLSDSERQVILTIIGASTKK